MFAGTTDRSANEDGTLWWIRVPACEKRVVPSARNPASKTASRSHTTGRPAAHRRHEPQYGNHEQTTWSPGFTPVTPSPTSSTTAEPSCPSTIGIACRWMPWTEW